MEIQRDQSVTSPDVNLNHLRTEAFTEAASLMFPDSPVARGEAGVDDFGPPTVSVERLRALRAIGHWLTTELTWMEHEAFGDELWEVRYASASDPTDIVSRRFADRISAESYAYAANYTSCFGGYKVIRRTLPINPEELPAALD